LSIYFIYGSQMILEQMWITLWVVKTIIKYKDRIGNGSNWQRYEFNKNKPSKSMIFQSLHDDNSITVLWMCNLINLTIRCKCITSMLPNKIGITWSNNCHIHFVAHFDNSNLPLKRIFSRKHGSQSENKNTD
jgi:hypothetical protein